MTGNWYLLETLFSGDLIILLMLISTLHPHQWIDKKFKRYKIVLSLRLPQTWQFLLMPVVTSPIRCAAALYCHISNRCQTDNKKYKPRLKVEPDTLGHLLSCALYIFISHQIDCLWHILAVISCLWNILTVISWTACKPVSLLASAYQTLSAIFLRLMSKKYTTIFLEPDIAH